MIRICLYPKLCVYKSIQGACSDPETNSGNSDAACFEFWNDGYSDWFKANHIRKVK